MTEKKPIDLDTAVAWNRIFTAGIVNGELEATDEIITAMANRWGSTPAQNLSIAMANRAYKRYFGFDPDNDNVSDSDEHV